MTECPDCGSKCLSTRQPPTEIHDPYGRFDSHTYYLQCDTCGCKFTVAHERTIEIE